MLPNKPATPAFEGRHGQGHELLLGVQNRRNLVLLSSANVEYCESQTPDIAAEAEQDEVAARRIRHEQMASPAAVAVGASVEAADEAARQALIDSEMQQPSILDEPEVPIDNVLAVDFLSKARQEVAQAQQMPYGEEPDVSVA